MSKPYFVRIKEIANLKNDHRVWKTHMLGDLSVNYEIGEMNISVWMVPIINPKEFKNGVNHQLLVENKYYDYHKSKQVKVGVGQLPLLTPGTIFVDGFVYERPHYITAKFDFTVTEENQTIISSGSSWGRWEGRNRYYIPARQFQLFEPHMQDGDPNRAAKPFPSKCLVVDFLEDERPTVESNKYPLNIIEWKQERKTKNIPERSLIDSPVKVSGLIIFCPEMIRFYYTFSSQSCQEVLSDGIAGTPNRLFNPQRTILPDANGRGGEIRLSKYVTDEDWRIMVRPAFNRYSLSEFRRPYISALRNKQSEGLFLPEARFPFRNQKTKLTVHGTYLQSGNRVYFLVYWIERCTAAFPYLDVEFSRDNPGGPKKEAGGASEQSETDENILDEKFDYEKQLEDQAQYLAARSPDGIDMQSDAPPGRGRDKIKLLFEENERFEYLENYPATKVKSDNAEDEVEAPPPPPNTTLFIGVREEMEIGGTAPASGTRPIAPTSVVPKTNSTESSSAYSDWETREVTSPKFKDDALDLPDSKKTESGEADELPTDHKTLSAGQKKLPINLAVFKEILNVLENNEKVLQTYFKNPEIKDLYRHNIETRMIAILPSKDIISTENAVLFPMRQTNDGLNIESSVKTGLPPEIFMAEITDRNKRFYAYLFDIEARKSQMGEKTRGFKMLLCFESPNFKQFDGNFVQNKILTPFEDNAGNWDKAFEVTKKKDSVSVSQSQDTQRIVLKAFTFKHDLDSTDKYAARILKALFESRWPTPDNE